jgi:hypothetical protein
MLKSWLKNNLDDYKINKTLMMNKISDKKEASQRFEETYNA